MKTNRIEGLCYTQLHIIHIVLGVNTVNKRVSSVRWYWLKEILRVFCCTHICPGGGNKHHGGVDVSIQLRLLFHP